MSESFRFLHGSDFRLDQPMRSLPSVASHLSKLIADAPYTAATRFFDLAITESVDFVLLSGNLLESELASCRPAAFLLNQFERLRAKGIMVYWCAGELDQPDRWPSGVELPDNVVSFSAAVVEEATHSRKDKPIATIVGAGFDSRRTTTSDFIVESEAPFPIALTNGKIDFGSGLARNIRYWAVGGNTKPAVIERGTAIVAQAGTQQSRSQSESGGRGCQSVRVDSSGAMKVQFHELDAVRWLPQMLAIAESASIDDVQNLVGDRALKLLGDHPDRLLLVDWHITASGPFDSEFRVEKRTEQTLKWLRDEFGRAADGLWSVDFKITPPESLPDGWYEEDTILGDYLRAIGRYQSDISLNLALHEYLPESVEDNAVASVIRVSADRRSAVLAEAAVLGAGYLAAGRDGSEVSATNQF